MTMSPQVVFQVHLACGYAAWLLCLGTAIVPRLQTWDATRVQRAIAMLHSFRFMGLVFILPGIVGALPSSFSTFAAYGDFTTALLAMAALLTARVRGAFWFFVVAFNVVGMTDLVLDYRHAIQVGLPAMAGELGAAYAIPIVYVPLLMLTHLVAFYLLLVHARPKAASAPPASPRHRQQP